MDFVSHCLSVSDSFVGSSLIHSFDITNVGDGLAHTEAMVDPASGIAVSPSNSLLDASSSSFHF